MPLRSNRLTRKPLAKQQKEESSANPHHRGRHPYCWYRRRMVHIDFDDIIIGSTSFDEDLRLLKEVLSRLRNAGLTIKSSKVHLYQKTLRFLGHLVSVEGISPDPEKVETVRNWPRPQTSKDVRSFLGLCNSVLHRVRPQHPASRQAPPRADRKGKLRVAGMPSARNHFASLRKHLRTLRSWHFWT